MNDLVTWSYLHPFYSFRVKHGHSLIFCSIVSLDFSHTFQRGDLSPLWTYFLMLLLLTDCSPIIHLVSFIKNTIFNKFHILLSFSKMSMQCFLFLFQLYLIEFLFNRLHLLTFSKCSFSQFHYISSYCYLCNSRS